MPGPDSSYSCFEHRRFGNVLSDARIEPPVQMEYLCSEGATILTFMLAGDSSEFFLHTVCEMVVLPERATFPYRSQRMSRSHLKMEFAIMRIRVTE